MLYKIVKVLLNGLSKRQERATSKFDLRLYFFSKIEFAALAPKKTWKRYQLPSSMKMTMKALKHYEERGKKANAMVHQRWRPTSLNILKSDHTVQYSDQTSTAATATYFLSLSLPMPLCWRAALVPAYAGSCMAASTAP
jgi:hypothetical protein